MSSPVHKRATDSFYQFWGNLKNNVTQQTQLKAAIYNFVIAAVVASCVAVCLVMGPFLKPLLWALLVGAVLFPFKYSMASSLKCWFQRLEDENTHLLVGIALAPIEAVESFGAYLWTSFMNHMQLLIGGTVGLLALRLFISYAPKGIFCVAWRYIRWCHTLCGNILNSLDYKIVRIHFVLLTVIFQHFLYSRISSHSYNTGDCYFNYLHFVCNIFVERRAVSLFYAGWPKSLDCFAGVCVQLLGGITSACIDCVSCLCNRWLHLQFECERRWRWNQFGRTKSFDFG